MRAGAHDGDLTVGALKRHGDFGLGTFDALNGEMIEFDGQVWQVPASGRPTRAADDARVPFAVVVRFSPHQQIAIPASLDMAALGGLLDSRNRRSRARPGGAD